MGKIRDTERTRKRIIDAAAHVFSEKGFDGTSLSEVARIARASKQLIHHHFRSKEDLFKSVHDSKFRPITESRDTLPTNPVELIAARFNHSADDSEYIRFLTWEAAGGAGSAVPGRAARQQRLADYGMALKSMQNEGKIPEDLDHKLVQIAILALATYPMAFGQITELVTGYSPTTKQFQVKWRRFLHQLGEKLFCMNAPTPAAKKKTTKVKKRRRGTS